MWMNVKNNKGVSYAKILKNPYYDSNLILEHLMMSDVAFYCISQRKYGALLELEELRNTPNLSEDEINIRLEHILSKVIPAF